MEAHGNVGRLTIAKPAAGHRYMDEIASVDEFAEVSDNILRKLGDTDGPMFLPVCGRNKSGGDKQRTEPGRREQKNGLRVPEWKDF